ncbi:peptidoglycan editing factor PgeF [Thiorhodospira sibirica]|uniref:peptidoglycan editing factor PgeF n=1 Tax=Thiorhodospira sibirica TaxID=154347 RepID=UPI00022C4657|nr:peptidoglycan editing factor PgeF [Thiorhodospira sibirica]
MNAQWHNHGLRPQWPAPSRVSAFSTTRLGGNSAAPFAELNLALHVGDEAAVVEENRTWLATQLQLPGPPVWLTQVHGCEVIDAADFVNAQAPPQADAAFSQTPNVVCAVMTADCLPVLLCTQHGDAVAVAHAGWRGLAQGVLEATVQALKTPASRLYAWLGPCIGPSAYEVGSEVYHAFVDQDRQTAPAFTYLTQERWLADLQALAQHRLQQLGVVNISAEPSCTFHDLRRFFSYRRDGQTGRMATLIWFAP